MPKPRPSTPRPSLTEDAAQEWVRPITRENLSDKAYAELRGALMRGLLKPGAQLPLRPVSERFGISATPMREALTRLVVERALVLDARGTVTVPRLTRDQLLEIRAIRVDLEGRCAERAARLAGPEEVDALDAVHREMMAAQARADFMGAIGQNTRFHLELCRMGRLPITRELVEGLWVRCGPLLTHLYDAGIPPDWDPHPHTRVILALRARDAAGARAAIRFDIENGGQGLLNHVAD